MFDMIAQRAAMFDMIAQRAAMFSITNQGAVMFDTLKLWWIKRQIAHLERHERDVAENLKHIRHKLLPALRDKRNALLFPEKYHGTKAILPPKTLP